MLSLAVAFVALICIKPAWPVVDESEREARRGEAAYPGSIREMINVSLAV